MTYEITPIAALFINLDNLAEVPTQQAEKDSASARQKSDNPPDNRSALKRLQQIAPGIEEHAFLIFSISGPLRPEMLFFKRSGLTVYKLDNGHLVSGPCKAWLQYCRTRAPHELAQRLSGLLTRYKNR